MLKKEILLFNGKKTASVDIELFAKYELYVNPFGPHTPEYLVDVLELTEDMTNEELSKRLSDGLQESIDMSKFVGEYLSNEENRKRLFNAEC